MLRLLGFPRVELEERQHPTPPKKAFILVALLILVHRNLASRASLAATLWEDASENQAQTNLRQLLLLVRRWEALTGLRLFRQDRERVYRDDTCLPCDVELFQSVRTPSTAAELTRLLDLYRGELLCGMMDREKGELSRQIDALALGLKGNFATLALEGSMQLGGAVSEQALRRLHSDDTTDEPVFRALVRQLASQGETKAIAELYSGLETRLRDELQTRPSLSTRILLQQVLSPSYANKDDTEVADLSAAGQVPRLLVLRPATAPYKFSSREMALARAMMDDITITLCRLRTLAVLAPHTAHQLSEEDPGAAAERFRADYLVAVRLLPSAPFPRLCLSMSSRRTGEILFGHDVELRPDSLGAEHAALASAIAGHIAQCVESLERTLACAGAEGPYAAFLIGMDKMRMLTLPNVRKARRSFVRALEDSPSFGPALSMLARTLGWEWILLGRGDNEPLLRAQELARRAVEQDPLDARGWRELGRAALFLGDLDGSMEFLNLARDRAPHYADVMADEADAHVHNSDMKKAVDLMDRAMALNPLPPDDYLWTASTAQFFLGNYDHALALGERMKDPLPASRFLASCAAMSGDDERAAKYRKHALEIYPDFSIAQWRGQLPMRDPDYVELYVEALRRAGFH